MQFTNVRLWLREQTTTRLVIAGAAFTVGAGLVLTSVPVSILARPGVLVAVLATYGAGRLLDIPVSWFSDRYEVRMPSWRPWSWWVELRWYGPHQTVQVDGRPGVVVDWIEDRWHGAGIWALVLTWPKGSTDDTGADITAAWRPVGELTPAWRPPRRISRRRIRWSAMFRCMVTGQRLFSRGHRHAHHLSGRRCRPSWWRLWPVLVRQIRPLTRPYGGER